MRINLSEEDLPSIQAEVQVPQERPAPRNSRLGGVTGMWLSCTWSWSLFVWNLWISLSLSLFLSGTYIMNCGCDSSAVYFLDIFEEKKIS